MSLARFKNLNKNIFDILISVIGNQDLCKLLCLPTPFNQPDIEDTSDLLFKKIFPIPRIPDIDETASNYLNVYFSDFQLSSGNVGIKSGLLSFEVICHVDLWRIEGHEALRPLSILHEIDEMVNDQRIAGVKKASFYKCSPLFANNNYIGYRVSYEIASGN